MKKTMAVLIPAIFAQAAGNVLLSMKMKEMGSIPWFALISRAAESPILWLGTALLIVSFVLFASALSWADLSFVVPAVSLEVVVNVIFADYFLGEIVSWTRWTGVVFITLGVLLVLQSERQKAKQRREATVETGIR